VSAPPQASKSRYDNSPSASAIRCTPVSVPRAQKRYDFGKDYHHLEPPSVFDKTTIQQPSIRLWTIPSPFLLHLGTQAPTDLPPYDHSFRIVSLSGLILPYSLGVVSFHIYPHKPRTRPELTLRPS
jgi:hypothetical protein